MSATIITVRLPWPSRKLSPNGRPTKREKISAVRKAREFARFVTLEAAGRHRAASVVTVVSMAVEWIRPQNRAYDDDNLIASFKSYRDGIADALRLDDKTFRPKHEFPNTVSPPGAVLVTIEVTLK